MLVTHSEPHKGQMSHICDISALRVNSVNPKKEEIYNAAENYYLLSTDAVSRKCLLSAHMHHCKNE